MTADQHLAWCKQRAREYLDRGDLASAVASMMSDLGEHPGTKNICGPVLAAYGIAAVKTGDITAVRRFIEGFK